MEIVTATKAKWKSFLVSDLDEQAMKELIELVRPLYTLFSPKRATDENIRARLTNKPTSRVDFMLIQGNIVGWCIYSTSVINGAKVLYHDGVVVDPAYRSKGIYHALTHLSLQREDPRYLSARTQNARLYQTMQKYSRDGSVYPRLDETVPPENIQTIGLEIDPKVDPQTLIVHDVYEGDRFAAEYNTSRDPKINSFFQKKLKPRDAFLLVALV